MTLKQAIIALIAIAFAALLYTLATESKMRPIESTITTFAECKAAGYAIEESYPARCRTSSGQAFVLEIGNELEKSDLIVLSSPRPNTSVTSPIVISGQARGYWFFEASFPITLLDGNGAVLAESYATASGNWMTEEFVPFTASISFPETATTQGTLVLRKANASGDPARDDALTIPVFFRFRN